MLLNSRIKLAAIKNLSALSLLPQTFRLSISKESVE